MRFAYIDSQGKQVPIPSVDALRLRIALKAIVDETVFYDAASERWGPASEHEIFRTLRRELSEQEGEGFVAPPLEPDEPAPAATDQPAPGAESDAPGEEAVDDLGIGELEVEEGATSLPEEHEDDESDDEWRFAISNAPVDAGKPGLPTEPATVSEADAPAEGEEPEEPVEPPMSAGPPEPVESAAHPDGPSETDPADDFDLDSADPVFAADDEEDAEGSVVPLGTSSWLDLEENEESAVFDLDETHFQTPDDERGDEDVVAAVPEGFETIEGFSQDRFDVEETDDDDEDPVENAGWGDEPPPESQPVETGFDDGEPLVLEDSVDAMMTDPPESAESAANPSESPRAGDGDEPSFPTREEVAARRADAVAKRGPRAGPPPVPRRRSRGAVGVGVVGLLVLVAGGAWWWVGRDAREGQASNDQSPGEPIVLPDLPSELQPRMRALGAEIREATLNDLRTYVVTADVPAEPDRDWLAGIYMASASQYPEIEAYWVAMERFLRSLQVAEDSVFVDRLDRRMAAEALPPDTAAMLEERILAGFRASSRDRGTIFQRARAVSEAALRLHTFLLEHEDEIAYVPEVGGLSADPVLEAVPDDPALGNQMWDQVGEITAAMDALDFLDRVTTERFVGAVLDRLAEIPVR